MQARLLIFLSVGRECFPCKPDSLILFVGRECFPCKPEWVCPHGLVTSERLPCNPTEYALSRDCNLIAPPHPQREDQMPSSPIWASYDEVHVQGTGNRLNRIRVLRGYPFTDSTAVDNLPKIAFDCNNCAGGKNFSCKDGYAGRLCVSCAREPEKWSSILGGCKKCNNDWQDYLIGIGGTSAVVLSWVGLNALAAGGYDALDIALQFTQLMSVVQGFNVPWPNQVETLSQVISFVNFDVDFIRCTRRLHMAICMHMRACAHASMFMHMCASAHMCTCTCTHEGKYTQSCTHVGIPI